MLTLHSKTNTDKIKANEIHNLFNSFESIAIEYDDRECWSEYELYTLWGYAKWERIKDVLARAKESCENASEKIADHFASAEKMISLAKVAQRHR